MRRASCLVAALVCLATLGSPINGLAQQDDDERLLPPEVRRALRSTPEFLITGKQRPDAATVAASIHYLSVIMSAWNPHYRRNQVAAILGADVYERGVVAGLIAPALYLIEQSLLMGYPAYAEMTGPVVAALSQPLHPFLKDNKLPRSFPKGIRKSPNRLVAISDYLSGVAHPAMPGGSKGVPGGQLRELIYGGSGAARRPDYASLALVLAGEGSVRERASAEYRRTGNYPKTNPGLMSNESLYRSSACMVPCALAMPVKFIVQAGKEVGLAIVTSAIDPNKADPIFVEKGMAWAVAEAGMDIATDGGQCMQTCLDVEKERKERVEAEEAEREQKDAELKKREEQNEEELRKVEEAKRNAPTEEEKAAAEVKEQDLQKEKAELEKEREQLEQEKKQGGKYGPDGGPAPRNQNGPKPPIDPTARDGYQVAIADGMALSRIAMKNGMDARQLRDSVASESDRMRQQLADRRP